MPRNDIILWLDLETNGASDEAVILEVGCVLTDSTPQLNVLTEFSTVVAWPFREDDVFDLLPYPEMESPKVLAMHTKNNLLLELRHDTVAPDIKEAEKMLIRWLRDTGYSNGEHIPLAGSGVGHFDRKFIHRDWPRFDSMLSYWVYDVGVIRRSLRLAGIELPQGDQSNKTHRALDDARQHAEEMRVYLKFFKDFARENNNESISGSGG